MSHFDWCSQVFAINLKKYLSYRVDFWFRFFGAVLVQVVIAYFLWGAIFNSSKVSQLGGYTFPMLLLYYLIVPFVEQMTLGDGETGLSREIYEGTFSRYIIYPLPLILYKYMSHLAYVVLNGLQLIFILLLVAFIWGIPEEAHFHWVTTLMFAFSIALGSYLIFVITLCLEAVAFWADNVWSLMVMLRFCVGMLGGAYLPLSMYPIWAQTWIQILPFQYAVSFPIKVLLGQISLGEWIQGVVIASTWCLAMTLATHYTLNRGSRNYSGVGM